jgi:putative FmdB family regulatory protein
MPIYEYHCEDCDNSFETFVQPGHYGIAQCPSCNSVKLSREMSVFASRGGSTTTTQPNGNVATMMRGGGCCGGSCGCH